MNNDKLNSLIQGIGVMTELWIITYQNFRNGGMNEADAVTHTKAFIAVLLDSALGQSLNTEDAT